MTTRKKICKEIIEKLMEEIEAGKLTDKKVKRIFRQISKKYKFSRLPSKVEVLSYCKSHERTKLKRFLMTKPIRTVSGVAVITVVAKPVQCPNICVYCPKGINAPQSYTGLEPAVQRAIRNNYNPFMQVKDRIEQFKMTGHWPVDKVEIIILGGTFLALNKKYQTWFVKRIFDALNGRTSKTLEKAKKINETTRNRCVGLTIETRSDYCKERHVDMMLNYGTTRVEIGVQTIYPDILKEINRGHTLQDTIEANKIARNAGFKINFHLMPNLPGSDFKKDLRMFKTVFQNQNFRPDYLKIYPTVVVKGTQLYEMWKKGEYKPYVLEELIELLVNLKKFIPKYCRIQRMVRDIPATEIAAGCKRSNLRELVQNHAKELGIACRCIRCREVGFKIMQGILPDINHVKLYRMDYEVCDGKEIFLSYEDMRKDIILGFLRLRIPDESHRKEIDENTAIVRELKVMGQSVPIHNLPEEYQWQHRGYGKKLMFEGERIAKEEFDKNKIIVISAIGTRQYYRKLGYRREGMYVSKKI